MNSATQAAPIDRFPAFARERLDLADWLALATIFTASFAKLFIEPAGKVPYSNMLAAAFVLVTAWRLWLRPRLQIPREIGVLVVLSLALTAVYLLGWFNLDSPREARQFGKGLATWAVHGLFMLCLALHVAERGRYMFRMSLLAFLGGVAVNAIYGIAQFVLVVGGVNLDEYVVRVLTFGHGKDSGAHLFGGGIYRINGLMRDVNHLGVTVGAAVAMALAWQGMRMRGAAILTGAGALALTLSRSGVLAFVAGTAVTGWIRRRTLNVPLLAAVALACALGVVVFAALMPELYGAIVGSRLNPQGTSAQTHLRLYSVVPAVLDQHPFAGLGLNTFAVEFESIVGREGFGPHSYVIQVLTETGLLGFGVTAALVAAGLRYALAGAGQMAVVVGVGIVATLAGNLFYLTAHLVLLKILIALAYAAPAALARGDNATPDVRMRRHDDDR